MNIATSLGKYQILGELGKGGFATVYRARDPDLGREVALKVLDPLLTRDPVWVARFRREARAVASLDHPRVVTVHEIGQAEGSLYIAMRLVEGGSLRQRIETQGALPWDEVLRLAGQIAEALDFAHGRGILHRDLKPANVLLDPQLGAVLTDFGFTRLMTENSMSISMSGGVVGTPAYIAPEVWEDKEPSRQTDVYALGCMIYELVTGQALFTGTSTPAVMRAHFQPRRLPETWPEGVPSGLSEVLLIALAQEPAGRYSQASEMAVALAGLEQQTCIQQAAAWGVQADVAHRRADDSKRHYGPAVGVQTAGVLRERLDQLPEIKLSACSAAIVAGVQPVFSQRSQVLTDIKGIDMVCQRRFNGAGIGTYWEVASMSDWALQDVLRMPDLQQFGIDPEEMRTDAYEWAQRTGTIGLIWVQDSADES